MYSKLPNRCKDCGHVWTPRGYSLISTHCPRCRSVWGVDIFDPEEEARKEAAKTRLKRIKEAARQDWERRSDEISLKVQEYDLQVAKKREEQYGKWAPFLSVLDNPGSIVTAFGIASLSLVVIVGIGFRFAEKQACNNLPTQTERTACVAQFNSHFQSN